MEKADRVPRNGRTPATAALTCRRCPIRNRTALRNHPPTAPSLRRTATRKGAERRSKDVEFSDALDQLDSLIAKTPSTPDGDFENESSKSSALARMLTAVLALGEPPSSGLWQSRLAKQHCEQQRAHAEGVARTGWVPRITL